MMKPALPADYLLAKSYSLPSSAEKSTKLLVNEYYHGNNQIHIQLEQEVNLDTFTTIRLKNSYKYKLGEVYNIVQVEKGRNIDRGLGKIIDLCTIKYTPA